MAHIFVVALPNPVRENQRESVDDFSPWFVHDLFALLNHQSVYIFFIYVQYIKNDI